MSLISDVFDTMPRRFQPRRAAGRTGVIQFDVRGEGGGNWIVTIADDRCTVAEGRSGHPDLTLQLAAPDFLQLISGRESGAALFMRQRLTIKGDMNLALSLGSMFGR